MSTQKEKFKKFIESTIDEVLKEMTGTGAVAGYSTPFAFTKNKNGNVDAAKAAGYSLVGETEDSKTEDEKEILKESVVGDPFLGRKISSYLAETNRMLTVVEALMMRKINPKHAKLMKENSFAKRTTKDVADIQEKFSRISSQFGSLMGNKPTLVKESSTPTLESRNFDIATGYDDFESDLSNLIAGYEKLFNESLVGKEVTIRASKGYGQIKKDYKITPSSVTLSLVKGEYQLVVKDKQQKDYYLDTTFKIVISGGQPQNSESEPEEKPPVTPAPTQTATPPPVTQPTEKPKL